MSTSFSAVAEPRNNFPGLLEGPFDLSEYCPECGVGKKQIAPLKMAREPKWGKRQSMQMRWFFDVFFVRRDTWDSVFLKFGGEAWPVLTPKGDELETIVQLKLEDQVPLQIPSESPKVVCRKCGRVKHHPIYRGFFPPPENAPAPIFVSLQEFGHEHASERALIVGHDLCKAMRDAKMNCQYWCCGD